MCLYNVKQIRIAKRDIVCYKYLSVKVSIDGYDGYVSLIYTPIQRYYISSNTLESYRPIENELGKCNVGIHSYKHLYNVAYHTFVFKCIIPRGTRYACGDNGNGIKQYCSEKIIIQKMVSRHAFKEEIEKYLGLK